MKLGPPALLPLLRSPTQGELLALLYLHPGCGYSLTELARRLHVSVPTILREADRLTGAGLLDEERVGRARLLRAATGNRLYRALSEVLALTYGPLPVLSDMLAQVPGVEEAYIFGSWAARYLGEPGPAPNDVDVLVVGDADPDEVFAAGERARQRLGRDVNVHQVPVPAWGDPRPDDPFLTSVRDRPLVRLDLEETAA